MPEVLFNNYVKLIKEIKEHHHDKLQVRFSGGEPLVIGDKLFEYSNRLFEETGIEPFVLTNGRLLSHDVIEKSKRAHISAYLVSIENPFDQSEGAPSTDEVLAKIKEYDNDDVRVLPAIMVVKNNAFSRLFDICNYVYDRIGVLPSFCELTFHAFEIPTDEEVNELYKNVRQIAEKYYSLTAIRMFPYISPELYANDQKNYLNELDLENSIGITDENAGQIADRMFSKLSSSYLPNPCNNTECDWYEDCRIIKWLWLNTCGNQRMTVPEKLNAFCRLKNALNTGLYDGIMAYMERQTNVESPV